MIDYRSSLEIAEELSCECHRYDTFSHAVYDETPDVRQRVLTFMQWVSPGEAAE